MIRFFSTGYISRYLFIVFFGIIIWLPSFLMPSGYIDVNSNVYGVLISIFRQNNLVFTIISFIVTLFSAILLNRFAITSGMVSKVSTLIIALFMIFSSALVEDYHNNPIIWINLLLIFVWGNIMELPYSKNPIPIIFNASFLLGIASLFYTQLVFLFVFIWLSIFIHRIVTWRNLIVTIIGVLLPYFFLLVVSYSMGLLLEESYLLFNTLQIDFTPVLTRNPFEIAILVILLSIIIISAFGISGKLNERSINLRRNLLITIVFLILVYLILIIFTMSLVSLLLLCIPSVLLVSNWISHVKKQRFYNIALISLTVLIVLNQYVQFVVSIWEK